MTERNSTLEMSTQNVCFEMCFGHDLEIVAHNLCLWCSVIILFEKPHSALTRIYRLVKYKALELA